MREFHQHDCAERALVGGGEGVVDLLGGAVDLVQQGDAQERGIHPLNRLAAEVVAGQQADGADEEDRQQQRYEAPVPIHRPIAGVIVSELGWQEDEQDIGDVRNCAEQPA